MCVCEKNVVSECLGGCFSVTVFSVCPSVQSAIGNEIDPRFRHNVRIVQTNQTVDAHFFKLPHRAAGAVVVSSSYSLNGVLWLINIGNSFLGRSLFVILGSALFFVEMKFVWSGKMMDAVFGEGSWTSGSTILSEMQSFYQPSLDTASFSTTTAVGAGGGNQQLASVALAPTISSSSVDHAQQIIQDPVPKVSQQQQQTGATASSSNGIVPHQNGISEQQGQLSTNAGIDTTVEAAASSTMQNYVLKRIAILAIIITPWIYFQIYHLILILFN